MRKFLLALTLLLGGSAAYAQLPDGPPDAYVGAGVTQARMLDVYGTGSNFDMNGNAFKIFGGFRPIPFVGVEANYMDLGSKSRDVFNFGTGLDEHVHVDAHAFTAFAVGFFPLPVPWIDVFGKAGLARWTLGGQNNSSLFALDDHGTDFAWGAGAQAHLGALGLRLEYEQFNTANTNGIRAASFDVMWHFL